jgi:hypothetical protein
MRSQTAIWPEADFDAEIALYQDHGADRNADFRRGGFGACSLTCQRLLILG